MTYIETLKELREEAMREALSFAQTISAMEKAGRITLPADEQEELEEFRSAHAAWVNHGKEEA